MWMLNGTSDDERDKGGSSVTLSPFVFPPKNLPRICSALDMTDSDQRAKGSVEDVVDV